MTINMEKKKKCDVIPVHVAVSTIAHHGSSRKRKYLQIGVFDITSVLSCSAVRRNNLTAKAISDVALLAPQKGKHRGLM